MKLLYDPGWPLQMDSWVRPDAQTPWAKERPDLPRAFGQAQVQAPGSFYTHRWLMLDGLIQPGRTHMSSEGQERTAIGHVADMNRFGAESWKDAAGNPKPIPVPEWVQKMNEIWDMPEYADHSKFWIVTSTYYYDSVEAARRNHTFLRGMAAAHEAENRKRQVDDGPVGIYTGGRADVDLQQPQGAAFIQGPPEDHYEIWATGRDYHAAPGSSSGSSFVMIGELPETVPTDQGLEPNELVGVAWSCVENPGQIALIHAKTYHGKNAIDNIGEI